MRHESSKVLGTLPGRLVDRCLEGVQGFLKQFPVFAVVMTELKENLWGRCR